MPCPCACHVTSGSHAMTCTVDTGSSGVPGVPSCSPCDGDGSRGAVEHAAVPLLTVQDYWAAIDRLTNPTRQRLRRDDGAGEWVRLPSLLDQLVEAIESGSGQKTGGVQASKPPADVAAMSLLFDVTNTVRDALRERKIKRTFDLARDLRALASAVNTEGDGKRINACARMARSWAAQIKATISNDPDRTWRMHGAACRVCRSTTVPTFDDDGNETRQPALIVHSEDGRIERIECGFCSSVLTGPMLLDIVREARKNVDKEAS